MAGADHVLDPAAADVVEQVRELTDGRGADVSFECAGVDAVLRSAILSTRAGGTCVNVTIWGHEARVAVNDLVFREVNLLGSLAYAGDHPATIRMIADGMVDPYEFITGRIDLATSWTRDSASSSNTGERHDPGAPDPSRPRPVPGSAQRA